MVNSFLFCFFFFIDPVFVLYMIFFFSSVTPFSIPVVSASLLLLFLCCFFLKNLGVIKWSNLSYLSSGSLYCSKFAPNSLPLLFNYNATTTLCVFSPVFNSPPLSSISLNGFNFKAVIKGNEVEMKG